MADKGTALQEKITKQEQKIAAVRADIARLGTKGPGAAPKMGRLADKLKVLLATLEKTKADLAAWLAAQASTTTKPDQATEVQAP
jgi:hypothetical protein